MSGHGANSSFFNKENKDWMSRILATPTPSLHLITSHFCLTPTPTPHPLTPHPLTPQSGRRICITPKTTTAGWMYPGVPSHAKTCLDLPDVTLVGCMSTLEVIQKERLISKNNLKKCLLSCIT